MKSIKRQNLSTSRCQNGILVVAHSVSPSIAKVSQLQLPRFRSSGQPPETSHLVTTSIDRTIRVMGSYNETHAKRFSHVLMYNQQITGDCTDECGVPFLQNACAGTER
jgi:hypothetical protein